MRWTAESLTKIETLKEKILMRITSLENDLHFTDSFFYSQSDDAEVLQHKINLLSVLKTVIEAIQRDVLTEVFLRETKAAIESACDRYPKYKRARYTPGKPETQKVVEDFIALIDTKENYEYEGAVEMFPMNF